MPKNPKPEPDDKEQSERFIETARQLESDESGEAFERAVKTVTQPSKKHEGPNKKSKQ